MKCNLYIIFNICNMAQPIYIENIGLPQYLPADVNVTFNHPHFDKRFYPILSVRNTSINIRWCFVVLCTYRCKFQSIAHIFTLHTKPIR